MIFCQFHSRIHHQRENFDCVGAPVREVRRCPGVPGEVNSKNAYVEAHNLGAIGIFCKGMRRTKLLSSDCNCIPSYCVEMTAYNESTICGGH